MSIKRVMWAIQGAIEEIRHRIRYRGLPDALVKACSDPFDYAIGLRSGQVIHFFRADLSPNRQWVSLECDTNVADEFVRGAPFTFERGLDVRVSDIVWVADAPNGS